MEILTVTTQHIFHIVKMEHGTIPDTMGDDLQKLPSTISQLGHFGESPSFWITFMGVLLILLALEGFIKKGRGGDG
ncbi:MAG: hypothetical protein LBD38_00670 [Streptococcaceae bacterium]|jgi:hypothetical protein|nr:hypothetical protein [Streptococcaceae bacterium]